MAIRLNDDNQESDGEMHEINVTPFIDVMLVLLIIFMVAAPLATVDINVNLPAVHSKPEPRPEKPIYLSVKQDNQLFIGNNVVSKSELIAQLLAQTAGNTQTPIFFRADKRVDYQTLMSVMDELRNAGYLKIALMGLDAANR